MKKYNIFLALVAILNMASCKQGNKHVVTDQTEKQEYVKEVNKGNINFESYFIQRERDSLRAAMVPETVMEDLFTRQMNRENEYFAKEKYKDNVGAFEGAGYLAKGLYRPQIDCIMYTRHLVFCKVCRRSIENVIYQYVN